MKNGLNKAFIGIGSNISPRKKWINRAFNEISILGKISKFSNIYESIPVGYESKSRYLNCAIELETKLDPEELIHSLKNIEIDLLRIKNSNHYEDRTIDLDILFFNEIILEQDHLKIPHPRMHLRSFVLIPLFELCPLKKHPKFELTVSELYRDLFDKEKLQLYSE